MKQTMLKSFPFILCLFLCSCVKDMYDPSEKIPGGGTNPFSSIRVPADFDWSTFYSARLNVEAYDNFDAKYDYLVEVFDRDPSSAEAELLAIGTTNQATPFSKQVVYPKSASGPVYIRLTTPTGYQLIQSGPLKPGAENVCPFDSAAVCAHLEGTPTSQKVNRNPKATYTLFIEDSFPDYGDYDYNDVVATIDMETFSAGSYIEKVILDIEFRAVGATKKAGFYLQLPTVKPAAIQSVVMNNWSITSESNNQAVYAVSDDLHELFSYHGELINTEEKNPYRPSITRQVTIHFKEKQVSDFNIGDLDLFTTTLKKEGEKLRTEIHLRNFTYTEKGVRYRYYSNDNCVWALLVPGRVSYPKEHAFIGNTYPDILSWASGKIGQDGWYATPEKSFTYTLEK